MQIHKRSIIAGVIVAILLLVAVWYFTRPQGTLEFALAPNEVQLQFNDSTQTIQHKQTLKLSPGTYELAFSQKGFADMTQTVTVEKNTTDRIVVALTPQTDAAKQLIEGNEESKKVVEEFKKVRAQKLVATLPISGVGYRMTACESLKDLESENKAVCISLDSESARQPALDALAKLGYDPEDVELLIGTETIKTLIETDTFMVDYYTNVDSEHSEKPALFITPLNVPFVPFTATSNPQLENIKSNALAAIESEGYDIDKFDIFYSNVYLSRYNPHADEAPEHAMPPINP